jgi:cytochrome c553
MTAKKVCITLLMLAGAAPALAETPQQIQAAYVAEAAKSFKPSAERGRELFVKRWNVSEAQPSCTTCHGKDMHAEGKHVKTGKRIAPLTPTVNAERFTSAKKVAKWFKRNCTEVVGRECTAAEKADFIQFAIEGGKV